MNITTIGLYKVVEFTHGIVIMAGGDALKDRQHVELIKSDIETCCEYLVRYTDARAHGKDMRDAHRAALKGARILARGDLDAPGGPEVPPVKTP